MSPAESFRRRDRVISQSPTRRYRTEKGISLVDVSAVSGLSTFRISVFERHPELAKPGEIEAHRRAIDEIHAERSASVGSKAVDALTRLAGGAE